MIDTHAHFNSRDLLDLKAEIQCINNMRYLDKIINVAVTLDSNQEVIDIANSNEKFYGALGIHPLEEGALEDVYDLMYKNNIKKIVALGETGLDIAKPLDEQKRRFIETIELANYLNLPVIIHANKTGWDVLKIIKGNKIRASFVFHCFEPDLDLLKEIMHLDGYISVGTPITSPKAKKSLEVIKEVDINHLLMELDYPYMIRDKKMDGINVFHRIQEIKNLGHDELEETLDANAKRLFRKLN